MPLSRPLSVFLFLCVLGLSPALAQGVRALGMGGVATPDDAGAVNPAFGALPDGDTSVALPLGLLNALVNDRLDPASDSFDLLTVLDQATHLGTFLFTPARSPDELIVTVREADGVPVLALDAVGGSPLLATQGVPIGYRQSLALPVRFDVGVVRMGVRPYLDVDGRVTPDDDLAALFGDGSRGGSLDLRADAEAGVAVEVAYAAPVPLADADAFPGELYLGVRAAPFVGLARLDAAGEATVAAVEGDDGDALRYAYDADGFVSDVGRGGIGYGVRTDLGVAATLPLDGGTLTAGLSVRDLGVAVWSGETFTLSGDQEGGSDAADPVPSRRSYVAEGVGVDASLAYDLDVADLGVDGMDALLLAADAGYGDGALRAHAGAEAGFDVDAAKLLARAGLGYDGGPTFGIGGGARFGGAGFDLALHGYRAPFTTQQAIGVSAAVVFGF